MEGLEGTLKERYKMPVAAWWAGLPVFAIVMLWIGSEGLSAFSGIPYPSAVGFSDPIGLFIHFGLAVIWFGLPNSFLLAWCYRAPIMRGYAAMIASGVVLLLCGGGLFSAANDGGVYSEAVRHAELRALESLIWLVIGCVLPILVYLVLDRKELWRGR